MQADHAAPCDPTDLASCEVEGPDCAFDLPYSASGRPLTCRVQLIRWRDELGFLAGPHSVHRMSDGLCLAIEDAQADALHMAAQVLADLWLEAPGPAGSV